MYFIIFSSSYSSIFVCDFLCGSKTWGAPHELIKTHAPKVKATFTWRNVVPGKRVTSLVNFSERLYEKKVDTFARANSARACSDCLALTELTRLGEPKCL